MLIPNKKIKLVHKIFLISLYTLLFLFDFYLWRKMNWELDYLILVSLSLMFMLISLFGFLFPRTTHKILYFFGKKILEKSDFDPMYYEDSYKKFDYLCYLFIIFANILIVISIILKLL